MFKKLLRPDRINQLYAFIHQVLMAGYGFILLFIMVRIMPQVEVGRWLLFVSLLSISDILMQGLLQTIVVKEVAAGKDEADLVHKIQNNTGLLAILLVAGVSIVASLIHVITHFSNLSFVLLSDFNAWYPGMGLVMILFNLSWWVNMGKQNFLIILIQRIIYCVTSLLILLVYYLLYHSLSFEIAACSQMVGYAVSAGYAYFVNRFRFHREHLNTDMIKRFLGYGKYTMGTMIGSSLLRNADTFMIAGLMNTSAVAVYTLAQKIIELFEVVLRSVAVTLLPVLQNQKGNIKAFSNILFSRMMLLIGLFVPTAIVIFLFSGQVIRLLSGSDQYSLSAVILQVFMIYVLLLPIDRLFGIAFEACHLPQLNLIKTLLLSSLNILGNFIALYYFHSLIGVAAVSSIALIGGILVGIYFLNKNRVVKWPSLSQSLTLPKLKTL